MNFQLLRASPECKNAINNLMQFYMYDFSEFIHLDVEADGSFAAYANLEDYWEDEFHKFPYIIKQDEKLIGFVLVRCIESAVRNYFSIAEFFIMKKYRREGIGKAVAIQLFNLHTGQWEVYQKETNKPAQVFWKNVINEYTNGQFKERAEDGRIIQDFESLLVDKRLP
jgi:predicted acetyltransferase